MMYHSLLISLISFLNSNTAVDLRFGSRAILPRASQAPPAPSSGSQALEISCIFTTQKVKDGTRDFLS